ncbi:uncharacterized protein LOC128217752 [Mya arenaria]|uniref:uncharacterized protein LOC128217752 n=1 Tax=Mya arenaria TaxID=6604 RepID=UPI0022E442B2|nr:uncharacterized protein LOC128217752 [Mya arenaria]
MYSLTRVGLCIVFAYFGSYTITSAHGWRRRWKPNENQMCPSEDTVTHECFELTTQDRTCLVSVVEGCDPGILDFCVLQVRWESVPCLMYTCSLLGCCAGYSPNLLGNCVEDGTEGLLCENGGKWNGTKCECPGRFSGRRCEIPECEGHCENGGSCGLVNDEAVCICSSSRFYGDHCDIVKCGAGCENGGECVHDGVLATCRCQAGFQGDRCQYSVNPRCPPLTRHSDKTCDPNKSMCTNDTDCMTSGDVCCFDGCIGVCRPPDVPSCSHNDKVYPAGDVFTPSACERCVCQMSGAVKCTKMECRNMCTGGVEPVLVEDHCCKICPGNDSSETESSMLSPAPKFINCPERFIPVDTPASGKVATMVDLGLTAVDADGNRLDVMYSDRHFLHSGTSDVRQNVHIVTAFSHCDPLGRRAMCHFKVIVRDPHPPVFTSCPAEIYALNTEMITWQDPDVTDNVGIARTVSDGSEIRDQVLGVGAYPVSYIVWDYDENQAICAFLVRVFDENMGSNEMPSQLTKRLDEGLRLSTTTILGSAIGLLLAVSFCVCFLVRMRKMRAQLASDESRTNTTEFSNSIYAICSPNGQHTYANESKIPNLPDYSPPLNPPSYDQIDQYDELGALPVEDPPIYEEIPSKSAQEPFYENIDDTGHNNEAFSHTDLKVEYRKI